jgi:hypothetical protein
MTPEGKATRRRAGRVGERASSRRALPEKVLLALEQESDRAVGNSAVMKP